MSEEFGMVSVILLLVLTTLHNCTNKADHEKIKSRLGRIEAIVEHQEHFEVRCRQ